jgi:hypothetical protein
MDLADREGDALPSLNDDGEEEDDMQVGLSIVDLSERTSIRKEDIISAMQVRYLFNISI